MLQSWADRLAAALHGRIGLWLLHSLALFFAGYLACWLRARQRARRCTRCGRFRGRVPHHCRRPLPPVPPVRAAT